MTALLQIKTKYARKGVILSPGAVDAGFHGKLVLSMFNSSNNHLHIKCGDPVCQILFVKMTSKAEKPYAERSGNYQNQNNIIR
jgi:dCTP deaminase